MFNKYTPLTLKTLKNKKNILITTGLVLLCAIVIVTATVISLQNKSSINGHLPNSNVNGSCEIPPPSSSMSPLLIDPKTMQLIYPEPGVNATIISYKKSVYFSCPGGQVVVNSHQLGPLVKATCSNITFNVNDTIVNWWNVSCSNINPTIRQEDINILQADDPLKSCTNVNKSYIIGSIGFDLDEQNYLSFIRVCFDFSSKIALYSYYNLTAAINNGAKNVSRPSFRQDDLFYRIGKSINAFYVNGKSTINGILGLDSSSVKYINSTYLITRGHLAAMTDFYYAGLQTATFRYINAAPQWLSFNRKNWNQVEIDVRNYASNNKLNLQIWTGTYGITTLPNNLNSPTQLYLFFNTTDTRSPALPVPEVFWKLVYNPLNQEGIVLIGHNNPYHIGQKICDDISDTISWLNWDKENIVNGISYACNYNDHKLQNTIAYLPHIAVKQPLR